MVIVGYGAIGRAVGKAAAALGMRVLGVRRGPVTAAERESGVHDAGELGALLPRARVVVNLLPATPQTESFWSARRFSLFGPDATFMNVSRGRCVDDSALLAALDTGRPARAVMDVFREEPLPEGHRFWTHPRVRVTPHVAGVGTETSEGRDFAENWVRWSEGKPLLRVVDRARGY
jgi:glyoxylate/hydroxypyruvate reductase A